MENNKYINNNTFYIKTQDRPNIFDDKTINEFVSISHDDHISREEISVMLRDCLCLKLPNEDGEESIKVVKNTLF